MKIKRYCILCGRELDPKIHITKFGKTKKQMVQAQKKLLISVMKDLAPGLFFKDNPQYFKSIIKEIEKYE